MKKTLLFTSIIAGSTIVASSANAGNVQHLFYKPMAGQIVSDTSYNITEQEYKDGSAVANEIETAEIREVLSYGVSDKLTIDLDIAYQDKEWDVPTPVQKYDGFTNPEITARYRVANQADNGEFVDLRISHAPDVFDKEAASGTVDGTVAQGGATYSVGIDYGRNINSFSYKINFDALHNDDSEEIAVGGASVTGYDDRTDLNFGVEGQYRVNDMISVNAGAARTLIGNTSIDGVARTGGSATSYGADLNFNIDQQSAISISFTQIDADDTYDDNVRSFTDDETTAYGISYKRRF